MIRDTSVEAYHKIQSNGLLSQLRFAVYSYVFKNGPCTIRQAIIDMSTKNATYSISTRFSELEKIGVLKTIGITTCKYSGNDVLLWDVTSALPKKLKKEPKETCLMCGQPVSKKRTVRRKLK